MEAGKATDVSDIQNEDELDEEPGEVIESAPPLKVGEERELGTSGLKKKLLKRGHGYETPELGDEATGKLGQGRVVKGLDHGVVSMKKGEIALFTLPAELGYGVVGGGGSVVPSNAIVRFEVELVSWITVVDLSKDGGIVKKIIEKGERNERPGDLDEVLVSYIARLEDGTVFEKKGIDGEQPLEFITDEEQVIAGLDRAVATMKKGEQAILTIHPDFGFGSVEARRDLAVVPPHSNIVFEVEMLDFIREKAPWEMINHERLETARRKKEEGNLLFKEGKYQKAGKKYDKGADYVSEDGNFGDDESKLARELRLSFWLNGAACSLKLNDFQEAIKLCSKVLDIEFHNVKALYRRAQAYMQVADLVLAELDIKKALEVDPQNREVKLIEKNLKRLQVESNKRDAKLYTNIFGRMTKKLKVEKVENEKS
ncbi:hypothetical protein GBA52_015550 [Prunus armeniaca]|nr:hypothetical protein GBA52_015550 [Prunus armeniaca]